MTIEDFQLLAWLRVGEVAALIVFHIVFILNVMKVYKKVGRSLGGFRFLFSFVIINQIMSLVFSVSYLSYSLTKPEEAIQQYIEQQGGTSGPLFDVPKELIMTEKGNAI